MRRVCKIVVFVFLIIMAFSLIGCSEDSASPLSSQYNIGQEITLGEEKFNIYKIDDNKKEIYLLAQREVAVTVFSSSGNKGYNYNTYEGSIVESYVEEYESLLESKGVVVKKSGIIDKDDLYNLGFEHTLSISGLPYNNKHKYAFIDYVDNYWVGGYCKYNTYIWVYFDEKLDHKQYDNEFGVRPAIIIDSSILG